MVDPIFSTEPEFDFGHYGLDITSYRGAVLERLQKHLTIVTPDRFLVGAELNRFIASFKVGICLKHLPEWPIPSPARTSRLLHAKRGIAAEYVPVKTSAGSFVRFPEQNQDFVEYCHEYVSGPWRQQAELAYENFRMAMPMKNIMERLLDENRRKTENLGHERADIK